jgi:hypothetical protein
MRAVRALAVLSLGLPGLAVAQQTDSHDMMQHHDTMQHHDMAAPQMAAPGAQPAEPGQAAFAAIAEIVAILIADPETDWSQVDIEALRRHLIDMDNLTLRARVEAREIEDGAVFDVTSDRPDVVASIQAMVPAHAATMNGAAGMEMEAETLPGGARLTVTGPDPAMIRGLGLVGVMTLGMHHQAHHLAIARGLHPH